MIRCTRCVILLLFVMAVFATQTFADVKVGDKMPSLDVKKLFNNEYDVDLEDLEGYVVVVEFWATWCGPCKASIPHLNKMHKEYKERGVVFVGLSDENPKTVENFMKSTRMHYLVGSGSKAKNVFGVKGIPHAFVIDPDGIVRWRGHPMDSMDKEIEKAIKTYKPIRRLGGGPEWNAKMLDEIDKAIAMNRLDDAQKLLGRIDKTALQDKTNAKRYEAAMATVEKVGFARLDQAEADIKAGRYDQAIKQLRTLSVSFAGRPLGKTATKRLAELEADPKVRSAQRSAASGKLAINALNRAKSVIADGNTVSGYIRLQRIVERYPTTEAAKEAQKLLDELATDDAVKAYIEKADKGG